MSDYPFIVMVVHGTRSTLILVVLWPEVETYYHRISDDRRDNNVAALLVCGYWFRQFALKYRNNL